MTDHEAAARRQAAALAACLDRWGHPPWCLGTTDDEGDCPPECREVREVVREARAAGYLDEEGR